ncbi:MAG: hypothetical protein JKX82_16525 [Oleispira sp.]|nr:hypothetical protein [Oleispira sp.]
MLKQVAIILAAVAITACVEDTVTSSDVTKTAVEVAAAPVVETTEVKAEIETAPTAETTEAAAEAAPVVAPTAETTEAVATGSVEG